MQNSIENTYPLFDWYRSATLDDLERAWHTLYCTNHAFLGPTRNIL